MNRTSLLIVALACGLPAVGKADDNSTPVGFAGATQESSAATDWPQWRGPRRDGVSSETGLLKDWNETKPKLLWSHTNAGKGFSGVAVVGDRLYTLGARDEQEAVLALDANTGKQIWATNVGRMYENGWGDGPRCTPTVDGERLYVLSGRGNLVCLKTDNGETTWSKSLVADLGGALPRWGYCESPLIDGFKVVVTPGGPGCFAALDKQSGALIWTSTGLNDGAQYSSIIKANVGDAPIYLNQTQRGLVAVSAKTGKFLWRNESSANPTAVIPTPLFHEGYAYSTSGYGAGCALVKLTGDEGAVRADQVYANKLMKNHHGGVILIDKHVYGYSNDVGWVCQDFMTGELKWREQKKHPKGSIAYADGMFYCYSETDGACVLIEASVSGWKEHGRLQLPKTTTVPRKKGKIWTHPVIANGRLYLRDQDLLFCFSLRQ